MGDCIKALTESAGNFENDKEYLRKKGFAMTDSLAIQGLIGLDYDPILCETEFVAKTDNMRDGLNAILNTAHKEKNLVWTSESEDKSALVKRLQLIKSFDHDVQLQTIDEGIKFVISKTQEYC